MTESTGKTGRGIKLEISDGASPPVFTAIANATSITRSGQNAEEIDFTHLMSTGGYREFRQGFKDAGTVGFEYHFTPTEPSHEELLAAFESGEIVDFRINFEGAGWPVHLTGRGFIQNPGDININVGDPVGGSATLRVTGPTEFEDVV